MSYIALYRKWRPVLFEDVVEQEHVVRALKHSVSTGRIAHAYLFCGTRGTGKTTMAKIFSRAINCLNPVDGNPCNECEICRGILSESILDVIEIDAASNNSVDNVREIRDEVIYAPSKAKYKVYIIDEVHMLSTGAFNALLKTLEEPPSHVVFILATTDPHKLPATILSRCQRYEFRRISGVSIAQRLSMIAKESSCDLRPEAARLIAKMADGALRDAISILDQCISLGNKEVGYSDVTAIVGIVNDSFLYDIAESVKTKDVFSILELIEKLVTDGKDLPYFLSNLLHYFRDLLICKVTNRPEEVIEASDEILANMKSQCSDFTRDEIIYVIKELSSLESAMKWTTHPRVMLEVSLIKLCEGIAASGSTDLADRLEILEKRFNNADFTPRTVPSQPQKSFSSANTVKEQKPAPKEDKKEVKAAALSKVDITSIENWDQILNELKTGGRMVLYTNLLGTKAVVIDDRTVGILFDATSGFKRMLVSKPENLEVIEQTASKKLGREVKVKCLSEGDFLENSKASASQNESDELVDKARDIAAKLNVPLNIIDE